MSEKDTVLVAVASYEAVADAEADYDAIKALYYDLGTSHDFDAAVIARDENGDITVVKKHKEPLGRPDLRSHNVGRLVRGC